MKAVLHYRATPGFRAQIEKLGGPSLEIAVVDETDIQGFGREMREADVLLHVLEPVTVAALDLAPKLRLIQKLGVGVDTIDLDEARKRGIAVCNMPGANTPAVAELALLLMLATLRRLTDLDTQTRAGKGWLLETSVLDNLGELGGRTVGLVGFGAVGKRLAPMLRAIGSRVVYTDITSGGDVDAMSVSFDNLLRSSDVVSLHVPLIPATIRMMNERTLALMKPGAVLINTARGGLVDYDALHRAILNRHLRGAGLDVFAAEPPDTSHPLFRHPNVIVTPHLAWFTAETLGRSLGIFAENCRRLRTGEELLHRVI